MTLGLASGTWRDRVTHLSSFSLKRSGTREAVQPSQLRKQSLVGSILEGCTTSVDICGCVLGPVGVYGSAARLGRIPKAG